MRLLASRAMPVLLLLTFGAACHRRAPETGAQLAHALLATQRSAQTVRASGNVLRAEQMLADAAGRTARGTARDLVHGHIGARAGRAAVLAELAAARAALGDTTGALAAFDRMLFEAADPDVLDSLQRSPRYAELSSIPGVAERAGQLRAARRWRGDSAFVSPYRDTIPVEERLSGLALVWAEMRYGFVGQGSAGAVDLDSAYRATVPRLLRPMDTWAFYQEIERFMALAADNHTDVMELPPPLRRHRASVPLDTRRVDGRVLVVRVRSASLAALGVAAGQEVLALDGLAPDAYVAAHVPPQFAVHTPQARDVVTFGWRMWLGDSGTVVTVRLRAPNGEPRDVRIRRGGWSDAQRDPPVAARRMDGGIGYLALNTFSDPRVSALADCALATLGELRALVVDTRLNGGGSQDAGWHLISQWLSRPYVQDQQFSNAYVAIWRAWGGGTVRVPMPERVVQPHPTVHRTIPLIWLVGPRTASAAEGVAALVEQTGVGVTLGEPTFGSTGQPILVPLPGGGRARVRVEEERYNDGRVYTRRGIMPMIAVPVTADGLRAGKDEVLDRALEEVRRRLAAAP